MKTKMSSPDEKMREEAKRGNADSQLKLGAFYEKMGNGSEAVKWYRKAAKQGSPDAQLFLAFLYHGLSGVKKDLRKALVWHRKAARHRGFDISREWLGYAYFTGFNGEVPVNKAKAIKWWDMIEGDVYFSADVKCEIGLGYATGEGVKKDLTKAVRWIKDAARESIKAQYTLGCFYYHGRGVAKDRAEAVKWFKKAADQGYTNAQYELGNCFSYGEGVIKDAKTGTHWWLKAANQGHSQAETKIIAINYLDVTPLYRAARGVL